MHPPLETAHTPDIRDARSFHDARTSAVLSGRHTGTPAGPRSAVCCSALRRGLRRREGQRGSETVRGIWPADRRCPRTGGDRHGPESRFFRGAELSENGMDRRRADYMGMLGTVMNCLALQDYGTGRRLHSGAVGHPHGASGRAVHPAARHPAPAEGARGHLRRRHRAALTSPPTPWRHSGPWRSGRTRYSWPIRRGRRRLHGRSEDRPLSREVLADLTYDEALLRNIRVMDLTAMTMCKDNDLPMMVFGMEGAGNAHACPARRADPAPRSPPDRHGDRGDDTN